ncbi:hypothetical protein TNCV_1676521 [Trichonephila clavipes]|nr:hypothetical protein TNCV_1676521 [Trichonephila clavipes]
MPSSTLDRCSIKQWPEVKSIKPPTGVMWRHDYGVPTKAFSFQLTVVTVAPALFRSTSLKKYTRSLGKTVWDHSTFMRHFS